MSTSNQITAFLGATGGCCANALACTLNDGRSAVALARTPAKLTKLLLEEHGIPQSTLDAHLTIVPGSATDISAVKALLAHRPTTIFSGVGGAPKMRPNLLRPVGIDQPTICADTMATIVAALRELSADAAAKKPYLVVISSTGVSGAHDVPLAMRPLYRFVLAEPHVDKRAMEAAVVEAALAEDAPLAGFVIVRPTLLLDGKPKGVAKIRVGWERHGADKAREAGPGPAVGYSITRADVGGWIFEELVKGNVEEWDGRCVSLTA